MVPKEKPKVKVKVIKKAIVPPPVKEISVKTIEAMTITKPILPTKKVIPTANKPAALPKKPTTALTPKKPLGVAKRIAVPSTNPPSKIGSFQQTLKPVGNNNPSISTKQRLQEAEQKRNQMIASEYVMKDHTKPTRTMATPIVNMADIDDIFSAGIARVRGSNKANVSPCSSEVSSCVATEERTAFNLDDIFAAGIAKAKSALADYVTDESRRLGLTHSAADVEEIERWMRKEREHIDAYRNLTKEEWDAKYGKTIGKKILLFKISRNNFLNNKLQRILYVVQKYVEYIKTS